jgi:hypothetical protein
VEIEIEEVQDIETLEEIALASNHGPDIVSDAVSIRLERIRNGTVSSVSIRTATESQNSVSFRTARSSLSLSIDSVMVGQSTMHRLGLSNNMKVSS